MLDGLNVLHLNVGKRRQVQLSLLNDEGLKDFTALATVEPYIYRDPTTDKATVTPSAHWYMLSPQSRGTTDIRGTPFGHFNG